MKSLEETDNNVLGFFDIFEGRREFHSSLNAFRQQITKIISHVKTVN